MNYEAARQKLLDRLAEGVIDDQEFHKRLAAIDRAEALERAKREVVSAPSLAVLQDEPDREGVTTPLVVGPGFSLGKYVLRESLGVGGMGIVWVAYDTVGEREVALKILPQALQQQPAELQRFRKTFQLVERLHHSHICPLYELAQFPHPSIGWYQAMRLIRGRTLQKFCDDYRAERGDLPVDVVVKLLESIACALDDAHARKIVHRDIKPENILVEGKGLVIDHVWLIDFGIAAEIRSTLTRASSSESVETAGSRGYLAPELFQARYPDAFSDQYALAVVTYELLADRLPFHADDFLVLRQAVLEQPIAVVDGVTDSVMSVLRQALAKQPSERFASCREFVQRLAKSGEAVRHIASVATPTPIPTALAQVDEGAILGEEQGQQAVDIPSNRKSATTPKLQVDTTFLGTKAGEIRMFTGRRINFCWCPPGSFRMGSPKSESEAGADEYPQHLVTLTEGFWLEQTLVTQEQWEALMGSNPSRFQGSQNPVENISWKDAVEFCRKLTIAEQESGRLPSDWSFRLPTEAEWEYACRSGTTTRYCFGDNESKLGEFAWSLKNSGKTTHPVGDRAPNAWNLYDLHGNVWEWCEDRYGEYGTDSLIDPRGPSKGSRRVLRGGCCVSTAWNCRSAYRGRDDLTSRGDFVGFRLTLSPSWSSPPSADSEEVKPDPLPVNLPPADQRTTDSANAIQAGTTTGDVGSFSELAIKFCWCPAGEFLMGSPEGDGEASVDERPQHRVTLTQGFWLGQTEVTRGQFGEFVRSTNYSTEVERNRAGWEMTEIMKDWDDPDDFPGCITWRDPGFSQTEAHPVVNVSWNDAVAFCKWLSKKDGKRYRLPTEAEWEYACRAGTTTRYSFGNSAARLEEYAWYGGNSGLKTHPVGEKLPNAWGLQDLHGNVWEWCADWYGGYDGEADSLRVCRGGSHESTAKWCRSAFRLRTGPLPAAIIGASAWP